MSEDKNKTQETTVKLKPGDYVEINGTSFMVDADGLKEAVVEETNEQLTPYAELIIENYHPRKRGDERCYRIDLYPLLVEKLGEKEAKFVVENKAIRGFEYGSKTGNGMEGNIGGVSTVLNSREFDEIIEDLARLFNASLVNSKQQEAFRSMTYEFLSRPRQRLLDMMW